jgi:hypothetical protein
MLGYHKIFPAALLALLLGFIAGIGNRAPNGAVIALINIIDHRRTFFGFEVEWKTRKVYGSSIGVLISCVYMHN